MEFPTLPIDRLARQGCMTAAVMSMSEEPTLFHTALPCTIFKRIFLSSQAAVPGLFVWDQKILSSTFCMHRPASIWDKQATGRPAVLTCRLEVPIMLQCCSCQDKCDVVQRPVWVQTSLWLVDWSFDFRRFCQLHVCVGECWSKKNEKLTVFASTPVMLLHRFKPWFEGNVYMLKPSIQHKPCFIDSYYTTLTSSHSKYSKQAYLRCLLCGDWPSHGDKRWELQWSRRMELFKNVVQTWLLVSKHRGIPYVRAWEALCAWNSAPCVYSSVRRVNQQFTLAVWQQSGLSEAIHRTCARTLAIHECVCTRVRSLFMQMIHLIGNDSPHK